MSPLRTTSLNHCFYRRAAGLAMLVAAGMTLWLVVRDPPATDPGPERLATRVQVRRTKASAGALAGLMECYRRGSLPQLLADGEEDTPLMFPDDALTVVRRWTRADSISAISWAAALERGAHRRQAFSQIAGALSESDAAGALAFARGLNDEKDRTSALVAVGWECIDPSVALAAAAELPEGQEQLNIAEHVAANWAARDPDSALEWSMEIVAPDLRGRVLAAVTTAFAENDSSGALEIAVRELPPGLDRNRAVAAIVQRWAQNDPQAAAEWMSQPGELQEVALPAYSSLEDR